MTVAASPEERDEGHVERWLLFCRAVWALSRLALGRARCAGNGRMVLGAFSSAVGALRIHFPSFAVGTCLRRWILRRAPHLRERVGCGMLAPSPAGERLRVTLDLRQRRGRAASPPSRTAVQRDAVQGGKGRAGSATARSLDAPAVEQRDYCSPEEEVQLI